MSDAPLTREEVAEALRLATEANQGAWCVDDHVVNPGDSPGQWHIYEQEEDDGPLLSTSLGDEADCRHVANAHNVLPRLAKHYLETEPELTVGQKIVRQGLVDQVQALKAKSARLQALLERIRVWDHLATAADGSYWRSEIDAALEV